MKKVMRVAVLLLVAVVISAPTYAVAGTYVVGTSGGSWRSWASANNDSSPYWDNLSSDVVNGSKNANVGFYLTNSGSFTGSTAGPGALNFWGMSSAANGYDTNFSFQTTDVGQLATLKIEISSYETNNVFGWYEVVNGSVVKHEIFPGSASDGAVSAIFTPTSNYGFYLTSQQGYTFYTNSNLNVNQYSNPIDRTYQHFAVFQDSLNSSAYWLGVEDLLSSNSDKDYNDMIVKITSVPEPGTMLLLGFGLLGTAALRLRRRG